MTAAAMRTCVRMAYAELHCHSAFSFLDGASHPQELAGEAVAQGHTALALTDHDGLHGAMEMAQALKHTPVRHITGAEMSMEDGSHLTLLCETRQGYRNLCRLITEAYADTRSGPNREAGRSGHHLRVPWTPRGRAGVPVGLRPPWRRGPRDRGGAPRRGGHRRAVAAAHLRHRASADRDPAPLRPPRPPPQPAAVPAGRAAGGTSRGHRQRARPLARAHAAAGRDGGRGPGQDHGRVRAPAARQLLARAGAAGGHGRPLRRAPGRGGGVGPAGRADGVRPDQRPGLLLPGLGGPGGRRQAGAGLRRRAGGALPARGGALARRRPGGRGAQGHPPPGPVRLLPVAPRHAGAGARGGGRGARSQPGPVGAAARDAGGAPAWPRSSVT